MSSKKVLYVLIIISAILAIYFSHTEKYWLHVLFKPLTTILVILVPVLFGTRPYPVYLKYGIAALVFCLFGDAFLLNHNYFIWGLVSFLIGHIIFIFSFNSIGGFKFNYLPLVVLLIYGIGYYIYLLPGLNELAIPVFFYFLVITVMCWQGISLYLWKNSRALQYIAMGSVFFLISDSVLAFNKFATPFEMARILTLSTYWLSVGLIAIGLSRIELQPANTET